MSVGTATNAGAPYFWHSGSWIISSQRSASLGWAGRSSTPLPSSIPAPVVTGRTYGAARNRSHSVARAVAALLSFDV